MAIAVDHAASATLVADSTGDSLALVTSYRVVYREDLIRSQYWRRELGQARQSSVPAGMDAFDIGPERGVTVVDMVEYAGPTDDFAW